MCNAETLQLLQLLSPHTLLLYISFSSFIFCSIIFYCVFDALIELITILPTTTHPPTHSLIHSLLITIRIRFCTLFKKNLLIIAKLSSFYFVAVGISFFPFLFLFPSPQNPFVLISTFQYNI